MNLPEVNIELKDSGSSVTTPIADRVMGMVLTGVAVASLVVLETAYDLFSIDDAIALGITETDNPFAYEQIKDFYDVAGEGAELWVLLTASTNTIHEDYFEIGGPADKLKEGSGGRVKILGGMENYTTGDYRANTIEAASAAAQVLANKYFANKQPMRIIIGANWMDMDNLPDFATATRPNVMTLISGKTVGSYVAQLGDLLGTYAILPVQRKASRVKNGEVLQAVATFTNGKLVDGYSAKFAAILAKKYMFIRTMTNRTGYYWVEDPMMVATGNDYDSMPKGRVMDKVVSILDDAYTTELNDEIDIDEETGLLAVGVPAVLEQVGINAVEGQMLSVGKEEIVAIDVFVNPTQIVADEQVLYVAKVTGKGYQAVIDIHLSYKK